jgi:hypothetical protein
MQRDAHSRRTSLGQESQEISEKRDESTGKSELASLSKAEQRFVGTMLLTRQCSWPYCSRKRLSTPEFILLLLAQPLLI